MKILFIADIVGEPGRASIAKNLPGLFDRENPDLIIANAENAAGGKGLTSPVARELFGLGVDVITMGNHTFDRKEIESAIDDPKVLRPANYPPGVPGKGWNIYNTKSGQKVAVINIMGRVYMPVIDDPFRAAAEIIEKVRAETKIIFVDFHAEITSEKLTMGWFLDGRVSACIGTHTHIPTADERILPGGTAYLSDAGMTGPSDGVIGMDREIILKKYLTGIPQHFSVAKGDSLMQGCVIEINDSDGKAKSIKRFSIA
jgi:metallophosphoesterase (TIGR00282 family)